MKLNSMRDAKFIGQEIKPLNKITMKVQLIKEVNDKGETWYCIEKDGRYIPSTLTKNFEEAVESYNKVIAADPTREVIMEQEIDY